MKKQLKEWEKIFADHISDKELRSKIRNHTVQQQGKKKSGLKMTET